MVHRDTLALQPGSSKMYAFDDQSSDDDDVEISNDSDRKNRKRKDSSARDDQRSLRATAVLGETLTIDKNKIVNKQESNFKNYLEQQALAKAETKRQAALEKERAKELAIQLKK